MIVDSCSAPFRGLLGSLKSMLTTKHFGSQYELLCSDISVQTLRLRLWGQLVRTLVYFMPHNLLILYAGWIGS